MKIVYLWLNKKIKSICVYIICYQVIEICLSDNFFPTKSAYNLHLLIKYIFVLRWYVGDMSRQRAESLLKQEDKEGCFVVRNSSTKGLYTLSLFTKV